MEKENLFQRHLDLWARSHPKEAVLLPYIEDETLKLCETSKGEPNLCREGPEGVETFYSPAGAADEAEKWFASIDKVHVGALYVYGVGLGAYYQAAKDWLHAEKNRALIFVEDDLAVLRKFFERKEADELLRDPQAHIFYLKGLDAKRDVLEEIYWQVPLASAQVSALGHYQKSKPQAYEALHHEITYGTELKKSLLEEYLEFGTPYFVNCYQNLLYLHRSYQGNQLFGKFPKIPAIICGAGPSLEKNMHLLKGLKERAIIFAGGSAINILNSGSIQPHLCAGIDPNTAQNVRLHHAHAYEVPFFYRNRLNHKAFTTIHGPHLYLTGSGGYDVGKYFESKLNIEEEDIDEGRNVVTFCMEIARKMGCDPIIFVGLDLAFTDRKTYSDGVIFDPAVEQKTLDEYANFEAVGHIKADIYGKPIYTLWKWIAESEWIGDWVKDHPELHVVNSTEGGLGFPGVANKPLKEVVEECLGKQYDLSDQIHTEIQNGRMSGVTREKVIEAIEELRESLTRCKEDLEILLKEGASVREKIAQNSLAEAPQQSGRAALAETDLGEEPAYSAILDVFNQAYSCLLNSRLQKLQRNEIPMKDHERVLRRLDLNLERLQFLRSVAEVNCQLIDHNFKVHQEESAFSNGLVEESGTELRLESGEVNFHWKKESCKSVEYLYYESGGVKGESHYQNGLLHGPSVFYTEQGIPLAHSHFVEGKQEGECLWYYPTGALYSKQNYSKGLLEGDQLYYYEDGKIKTELSYRKGCLTKAATLYDEKGGVKRVINFG